VRRRVLSLFAGVALLLAGSAAPAAATPVQGEATRADTWLRADDLANGYNFAMGYAQLPAAEYHDGGGPDAVVTTGKYPYSGSGDLPWGIMVYAKTPEWHGGRYLGKDGAVIPDTKTVEYWIKTCKDDTGDSTSTCAHRSVTTDANGYFTATYGHTLASTAVAVVASGSKPESGPTIPTSVMVKTRGASSFEGRAINQAGTAIANKTIEIDLFATTQSVVNQSGYWHRAGEANVTTDSLGYATLTFPDNFNTGQAVSSVQVTGATYSGPSIVAGPIAYGLNANAINMRIFNHVGDYLVNQTVKIDYVASGPIGGSPRDPSVVPFSQWRNPTTGFTGACGLAGTDPCVRQSIGDLLRYRMDASLSSVPSIDGKSIQTWINESIADWAAKDVKIPDMLQTTTVGDEVILNRAADLGTAKCGDMIATWIADYTNGLNFIISSDVIHNTNTAIEHGDYPLDGSENCLLDVVLRHEYGHVFGLGHHPLGSAGVMASDYLAGGSVTNLDVTAARALYGYSGSRYRNKLKVSDFVRPAEGASVALVTVVRRRDAHEVPQEGKKFPEIVTPIDVIATNWVGRVPTVIEVTGGTVNDRTVLSPETLPLEVAEPGTVLLVQIRDKDARVLEALPVDLGRGTVILQKDYNAEDDVDGGDKLLVGLNRLREFASRRQGPPTTTTTPTTPTTPGPTAPAPTTTQAPTTRP
jgi:hypothetical protein